MASESETLHIPPDPSVVGSITQSLSGFSESEYEDISGLTRIVANLTSLRSNERRISKDEETQIARRHIAKIRNDFIEILRDISFLVRIFLFFACLVFLAMTTIRFVDNAEMLLTAYGDVSTCVFQWSEWSQCSANCSVSGETAKRQRHVIPETVIDMTNLSRNSSTFSLMYYTLAGLFNSECYEIRQTTKCNLYLCPVEISTLNNFTKCQYIATGDERNAVCEQYLKLPKNALIHVDEVKPLRRNCSCEEAIFPF